MNHNPELIKQLYHEKLFDEVKNHHFGFAVNVLAATPSPQQIVYLGLHQCYSHSAVEASTRLDNCQAGQIAVKRLLEGARGHYSPYEHASITVLFKSFNHGTVQQLLRSRIGVSPSVQSFRYTSQQILEAADNKREVEDVLYIRPTGVYHDRGSKFEYNEQMRQEDLSVARFSIAHVAKRLRAGMPPEQARGQLSFDYRQHCVVTFNTRSLMSLLDRRSKKDSQIEIQMLAELLYIKFVQWQPETADYYYKNRWGKALLAP